MAPIAQFAVTEDVVRTWWKRWQGDGAEPPPGVVEVLVARAGMIEGAMEDAAESLVRVLAADL